MRRIGTIAIVAAALCALTLPAWSETLYGKAPGQAEEVTVQALLAHPERYVDKTVRVKGRIHDVCPRMGCWIDIAGGEAPDVVRFKVNDGEIVFPVEAKGKDVVAEGTFVRIDMSAEEALSYAEHLAEEQGRTFDPKTMEAPTRLYQIRGSGAVVD